MNRTFHRLAMFAALLALIVIVLGAWVRLSHAGLGCPDWPGCYGQLTWPNASEQIQSANEAFPERPVEQSKAWKEMVHRYLAGLLVLLVLALNWISWRGQGAVSSLRMKTATLLGVILFQAALGMWTVTLKLWPLVVMGHLPPHPTDDFAGATAFFAMWMALFAFVDNRGEIRTKVQRYEEFVFIWLLSSGAAQIMWELPFVLMKIEYLYPLGQELQPSETLLWPLWLYSVGDTRYMRVHEASHATETLLAISGFFEIWAAYLIKTGKRYKTGLIIAALCHWGFMWANNSVIYLAEIYAGFKNIEDGWAGMWIKWFGMNLQWSVLSPLCTFASLPLCLC